MKIEQFNMTFPGEGDIALVLARDENGEIMGTLTVKRTGAHVGEFARLFVRQGRRRQGVAGKLLDRAGNIALAAGCSALSCAVHPENTAALIFYRRLGFTTAFQFGDGDLLMTLPIKGGAA